MIKHILKIVWADRKVNIWLLLELSLIFIILWFSADYLTFMIRRYLQPIGFNIENTYMIEFGLDEEKLKRLVEESGKVKEEIIHDSGWKLMERIKLNADVAHVAVSMATYPYYSGSNMNSIIINEDTVAMNNILIRTVSPEYFDVFKVELERGRFFTWQDEGKKVRLITGDENNEFNGHSIYNINTLRYPNYANPKDVYNVIGVVSQTKRDPFYPYMNETFELFPRRYMAALTNGSCAICIRSKGSLSSEDFVSKFTIDMDEQLNVNPLYLSQVTPFEIVKEKYMRWQDYRSNFKSIGTIMSFLLVNIFLALIGAFWFRTRERRNEIGLRMAIGSSQSNVKRIFVGETLVLVSIASIIGLIISVNIGMTDILKDIGVPVPDRAEKMDWIQYVLNFSIPFFLLSSISALAVWYPARQAAKTEPADALRDE